MAIFNIADLKVVFGWVFALLLSIAIFLYQKDQSRAATRDKTMFDLITTNHSSLQKSLEKKDKEAKAELKEQNIRFQSLVKSEVSAVAKQMEEYKLDQREFARDQKVMAIDIAKLKTKAGVQ